MKSLSFHWFLKTEKSQLPYPQTTEAASILFQCSGCFTTFLSLRKNSGPQQPTVQESSPSSLPELLQYYFNFPQPNCPSLLAGKAGSREGKEGRELRNYTANCMLMEKGSL